MQNHRLIDRLVGGCAFPRLERSTSDRSLVYFPWPARRGGELLAVSDSADRRDLGLPHAMGCAADQTGMRRSASDSLTI